MTLLVTPFAIAAAFALYVAFLRRFDRFKWKTMSAIGALVALALLGLDRLIPLGPIVAVLLYAVGLAAVYLSF